MEELRKRLDQLKPVVKIDDLYEERRTEITSVVVASYPVITIR
jgi:hypothetical protein